jgi:plastocyanin
MLASIQARAAVASLALCLLGASDPASDSPDPASEVVVVVSRQGFDPPALEVPRGTIVAFHRRDPGEERYRLRSQDGSLESWEFEEYTQWSHRFDEPGTYEFRIERHPEVSVRIEVR